MIALDWARVPQEKVVFSHINPEYHYTNHIYGYYFRDLLAFVEYIIVSFVEKYQWVAWKLFFDDRPYPGQEIEACYILLKDMPNVKTKKKNNSTRSAVQTDYIRECNPQQVVKIETINENEILVRIPGGKFMMVQPNVSDHTQLYDRLYIKWSWKDRGIRFWAVIKIKYGPIRIKPTPIWWVLRSLRTNLIFHQYYMTPHHP